MKWRKTSLPEGSSDYRDGVAPRSTVYRQSPKMTEAPSASAVEKEYFRKCIKCGSVFSTTNVNEWYCSVYCNPNVP